MRLLIGLAALVGTVTPPGALFIISARSAKAAAGDSAMVETASRTSGMASALSPQLQGKLPAHFVQLDSKTHRRFDELANASVRTDKTLVGLAMITGYCVSCHDTYRLEDTR
jgi:hypothetical protein